MPKILDKLLKVCYTDEMKLEIRGKLGVTQVGLARLIGVCPLTVSRWERDVQQPRGYNLDKLVKLEEGWENRGGFIRRLFRRIREHINSVHWDE